MKNPSYLMLSRHNIYYFRWPLPRQIQAKGKTIHIKLSLDTRDPKEAIRLSTMLQDHGYNLLRQDWVLGMDYAQIKAMVEAHFSRVLEERKRSIDRDGPLLPFPKAGLNKSIAYLQSDDYEGSKRAFARLAGHADDHFDDTDIAEIVSTYELDLSNAEKDRQKLKKLYRQGAIAMMQEVLAYSNRQEQFDFNPAGVSPATTYRPMLAKPENRLHNVIDKFTAEMKKSEAWGIRAEAEREDCLNLLKELVGERTDITEIDVSKARYVKESLPKF